MNYRNFFHRVERKSAFKTQGYISTMMKRFMSISNRLPPFDEPPSDKVARHVFLRTTNICLKIKQNLRRI